MRCERAGYPASFSQTPANPSWSKLAHLLMRFAEPAQGRILFDGIDIANAALPQGYDTVIGD